jgi:hypothetical protein
VCNRDYCHSLYQASAITRELDNVKFMAQKDMGIAQAAPKVPCSEGTLRRLDRRGIVKPARDAWGRRLFGEDDVAAAREYLALRRQNIAV